MTTASLKRKAAGGFGEKKEAVAKKKVKRGKERWFRRRFCLGMRLKKTSAAHSFSSFPPLKKLSSGRLYRQQQELAQARRRGGESEERRRQGGREEGGKRQAQPSSALSFVVIGE